MPYFTTQDGCKIFYRSHGIDTSDRVVIFLNGTTQTTLYWGTHAPAFSKRFGLLLFLRGNELLFVQWLPCDIISGSLRPKSSSPC